MQTRPHETSLLRALLDASSALAGETDVERTLASIVERAVEATDASYGAAAGVGDEPRLFVERGVPPRYDTAPHTAHGRALLRSVVDAAGPVHGADLARVPALAHLHPRRTGDALLAAPVRHRGVTLGALYIVKPSAGSSFTPCDRDVVSALGPLAGAAMDNGRLAAAEARRRERGALLHDIAGTIRSSLYVGDVLAATVRTLGAAAGVDRCLIWLAEGGRLQRAEHEWWAPGVRSYAASGAAPTPAAARAAATGRTQSSCDEPPDPALNGSSPLATLAAPLQWGNDLLGVVAFHSLTARTWAPTDVALIEAAAREVSVAVHHARLYQEAVTTAARLRDLDLVRREFVALLSHELMSPMTVIAGIADLLQKRAGSITPERRSELAGTLGREARRLARLVSETLDLEKIDQGGLVLDLGAADLREVIAESVADAGMEERTEILCEPGDGTVVCDRDRIKQVLLNLLTNASKFAPSDGKVTVTMAPEEKAVVVSVADEGPGIAPEDQDRLFHRFARLESKGSRVGGWGLGLYLAKAIVDRHGGRIWVRSASGQGATFLFRVPRLPRE